MHRLLFFLFLLVCSGLSPAAGAAPADELPARPSPFRFVNDQAQLLTEANAKTLENGLRRYADNTGTQIVVVTVPTLGGRDVADYGRALGEAWGIGQRDKNNGLVVLLGAQEHKVTIQAGSGLRAAITPELTNRVINQDMTPRFKQGNYFAGLRAGLNTLMLAANPDSNPRKNQPAASTDPAMAAGSGSAGLGTDGYSAATTPDPVTAAPAPVSPPEPESSGFGIGTLLIGAVVVLGAIWLIRKLFRRSSAPTYPAAGGTPDFLPNNRATGGYPQGGQPAPDFYPNRGGGGGSGVGGMLMTGAAAAAGAYLGNRMAHGHDTPDSAHLNPDAPGSNLGYGAAGPATSGGFPALDGTNTPDEPAPDYFSEESTDASPDYFSSDGNSSYDDTSSGDTGGGGFDDTNDNSGSW